MKCSYLKMLEKAEPKVLTIPNNTPRIGLPPPYCSPCSASFSPPVFGRYGHYINPSSYLKTKKAAPVIHEITTKRKHTRVTCPSARVGPYFGPHNVMWDPHVRRGSTIVHFSTLEKICNVDQKRKLRIRKQRRKMKQEEEVPIRKIFGYKGAIEYPEGRFEKLELTDYSQFLEEKEEIEFPLINMESQTDDTSRDHCVVERDVFNEDQEFHEEDPQDPGGCDVKASCKFKNKFQTGLFQETQVDCFHISKDMGHTHNPIETTIKKLSKILSTELLTQSILEEMETTELDDIRAQCDQIEKWIVLEQAKKAKEKRNLCKKMERIRKEEEFRNEQEKGMENARMAVRAGFIAKSLAKCIFASGFQQFRELGLIGLGGKDMKEMETWLTERVTLFVKYRDQVARDLLDDLIEDVEDQRCNPYNQDSYAIEGDEGKGVEEGNPEDEDLTIAYEGPVPSENEEEELVLEEEGTTSPHLKKIMSPKFFV